MARGAGKFGRKQEEAIVALLSQPTIELAARVVRDAVVFSRPRSHCSSTSFSAELMRSSGQGCPLLSTLPL